jgi:hypothetical protein
MCTAPGATCASEAPIVAMIRCAAKLARTRSA